MSLKKNVIANYLGQGWTALMGLAFIPLYIAQLGIEAYAVVGIFSVLLAWMSIVDFGLTPTVNREMARANAGAHTDQSIKDLLRTFEYAGFVISATVLAVVLLLTPYIVLEWLKPEKLTSTQLTQAMNAVAFALVARWIEQFYRAVLLGLQDAVWLNSAWALLATLRWGGAFLAIYWGPSTLVVFFASQLVSSVIGIIFLNRRVYKMLPATHRAGQFRWQTLLDVKSFAGSIFFGSVLVFFLTNADKIIVTKLLPLAEFGYYSLAITLAGSLLQIVAPMNNSMYPVFTHYVTVGDEKSLSKAYLNSSRLLSMILVPPAFALAFFSESVLMLWTGDHSISAHTAPLLTVMSLGMLLNGLMNLPYMLQLAYGWVRLSTTINFVIVLLIIPILYYSTKLYGAIGAASCWLAINSIYVIVTAHFMHKRLLTEEKWNWYKGAVFLPMGIGCLSMLTLLPLSNPVSTRIGSACLLIASVCISGLFLMLWYKNISVKTFVHFITTILRKCK